MIRKYDAFVEMFVGIWLVGWVRVAVQVSYCVIYLRMK